MTAEFHSQQTTDDAMAIYDAAVALASTCRLYPEESFALATRWLANIGLPRWVAAKLVSTMRELRRTPEPPPATTETMAVELMIKSRGDPAIARRATEKAIRRALSSIANPDREDDGATHIDHRIA